MTRLPGSAIADTNIPLEPTVMVSEMTIVGIDDAIAARAGNRVKIGRVTSGRAYRTDGAICYSGYPTASVQVY